METILESQLFFPDFRVALTDGGAIGSFSVTANETHVTLAGERSDTSTMARHCRLDVINSQGNRTHVTSAEFTFRILDRTTS